MRIVAVLLLCACLAACATGGGGTSGLQTVYAPEGAERAALASALKPFLPRGQQPELGKVVSKRTADGGTLTCGMLKGLSPDGSLTAWQAFTAEAPAGGAPLVQLAKPADEQALLTTCEQQGLPLTD